MFGSNLFVTGTYSHVDGGFQLAARGGTGPEALESWQDSDGVWHDSYLSGGSSRPADELKPDGSYFFDVNLGAGTYKIAAAQPAVFLDGRETAGNLGGGVDDTQDSNQISGISVGAPGTVRG